jgi:hypothetical protein
LETAELLEKLRAARVTHEEIAEALGRSRSVATKLMAGDRTLKANEIAPLLALLDSRRATPGAAAPSEDYVEVDLLPVGAGMGGPGIIDGELDNTTLPQVQISRALIEDRLRGRAGDFILIDVRGDSMQPDFADGDQLLCDRRDTNPAQPGPFALWDGDGYVVKNVERIGMKLRIFSTNQKYRERMIEHDDEPIHIIGRPVWFARSLR